MKKKTITLFLLILAMIFSTGCASKSNASADNTGTSSKAQVQGEAESSEAEEDLTNKTQEQLVAEGKDYFYATNGQLYDKKKAEERFQVAADQGSGLAYYYLGEVVKRSDDQTRFDQALAYYEKAVELGCDLGLLGKGDLLEYGRGMERDSEQARQLYEEALSNGCVDANIALGDYYRDGVGVDRDYVKALEYYSTFLNEESALESDDDVYVRIGKLYFTGIAGIDRDYQEAINWYNKGRDAGKTTSITELGNMYYSGYGVKRDYNTALSYFTEAAEMKDGNAM